MKTLITISGILLLSGLLLINSVDDTSKFSPSITYSLFPKTADVLAAEKAKLKQDRLKAETEKDAAEMLKLSRLVELFLRIPR